MIFHRHSWRVNGGDVLAYRSGDGATYLNLQCVGCAKPRRKKVANFPMQVEEINAYAKARFPASPELRFSKRDK